MPPTMDLPIEMKQMALGGLGPWELAIILVIVLIIFGAGRLPSIGGAIGQAIKNFKKGVTGEKESHREEPRRDGQDRNP